jgi:hypothetical protein
MPSSQELRSLLVLSPLASWIPEPGPLSTWSIEVARAESLEEVRRLHPDRAWDVVAFRPDVLRPTPALSPLGAVRSFAPEATFLAVAHKPDVREGDRLSQARRVRVPRGTPLFTPQELLERADSVLYCAKTAGRNRVAAWKAEQGPAVVSATWAPNIPPLPPPDSRTGPTGPQQG